MTICCLNPDCENPVNPDGNRFCQSCRTPLVLLLRNRFRVMRVLSDEGGFGKTYLAEDVDKLDETCVIKQLAPKAESNWALKKAVELFHKEAQRLQELGEHSQIPTLIAYFEEDSYLYLVQQYIDGQNLLRELNARRQKKSPRQSDSLYNETEIRQILLDLLPVLRFIHTRGVIHRDIKPQNIIRRQSSKQLTLIDFGSSKQLTAKFQVKMGTSIGSHGYSPIEQIRDGAAYPASDLFSLGATVFHLLTGISPFKLWTEHGYAWVSHWQSYVKTPLSEGFILVLDKLLKKDIHQRYQSAEEVIKDLNPGLPFSVANSHYSSYFSGYKLKIMLVTVAGILLLILGEFWYKQFNLDAVNRSSLSQAKQAANDEIGQTTMMPNFSLAVTIRGYASSVLSTAISPDGNTVASTNDRTIQLWSLQTGQAVATLSGHNKQVNAIAITPDGKMLVSGSDDNTIKLWNLVNGQEIGTLVGNQAAIHTVAISADGKYIASGSDDKIIKIWNLATREEIYTLSGQAAIRSVAFSPDAKYLASASDDKTIKLWNLQTGREIGIFQGHRDKVTAIAFSSDGKYFASGSSDKTIKLWNLETGKFIRNLEAHTGEITAIAFNPDGMTLASSSSDKTIKIWNYLTAKNIRTLAKHGDRVESFAFSKDGKTIASGGADRTLRIWRYSP